MLTRFTIAILLLPSFLAKEAFASPAAIAVPDKYAAEVATSILKDGGNAVDVAVAVAFSLSVTYPEAGNIGGGGFMTSFMNGKVAFLDFREQAPIKATRNMFLDNDGNFVQRRSLVGALASGVPGTVKGLHTSHERYGSLSWRRILSPAIKLAREGFIVEKTLAQFIKNRSTIIAGETNFSRYFGHAQFGILFKQPELANTLSQIAADPNDFYKGSIAKKIVSQMERSGGLITLEDLANYRAVWRKPIQTEWREMLLVTAPPPSSGGIALVQLLKMWDLVRNNDGLAPLNSAEHIHLMSEISKRVFADRAEYLGDPDFVDNRVTELIDDNYLTGRASTINLTKISPAADTQAGLEPVDTTHFSIIDHQGNAVSVTYTLNWDFGSGVVVEGAGFLLNNEMDDFAAKPGVPNKFGVIGNEKNSIEPKKRMLSSMTPTILIKGNQPVLVIGSPGGSTIFTSIFQAMVNIYDFGLPLQLAINSTRFHHQLPETHLIRHDQRQVNKNTVAELNLLGYAVKENPWGNLGDLQAVSLVKETAMAAADNRGRGIAKTIPDKDDERLSAKKK